LAIILLQSCGPTIEFDKSISVGESWSYNEPLLYDFNIDNVDQNYDLHFVLEHSEVFSFQNLYVLISTTYPDGKIIEDEVSLQLANQKGEFSGKCSGEKCKVTIVLQENFKFQNKGNHVIKIAQHSRSEVLDGIYGGQLQLIHHKN